MSIRRRTLSDCSKLIESEIGWIKLGRAIGWINDNYDNAWTKHHDMMYARIQDPRYHFGNEDFLYETWWLDYEFCAKHLKIYKAESPEFNKAAEDLFANLGWKESDKTISVTEGTDDRVENQKETLGACGTSPARHLYGEL
jgi:hypothetical protein